MENLHQLSDEQLIHLFQNEGIDKELKASIINEIDRRDLKREEIQVKSLDLFTKLKIIITSGFLYRSHIDKTNELLAAGRKKEYKQYWNYFIIGLAIKFILFLIIAKYVIKPKFIN